MLGWNAPQSADERQRREHAQDNAKRGGRLQDHRSLMRPCPVRTLSEAQLAATALLAQTAVKVVVVLTPVGAVILSAPSEGADPTPGAGAAAPDFFCVPHIRAQVVDAIGAADAFTGGFTAALGRGLSLRYSAVWGMSASACSVSAKGAQLSMPKEAQMKGFLHDKNFRVDLSAGLSRDELWAWRQPRVLRENRQLHEAVVSGDTHVMTHILNNGTQTYDNDFCRACVDYQGLTMLHMAVVYGNPGIVGVLLEHIGAPCSQIADLCGRTALDTAFEYWNATETQEEKDTYCKILWMIWTVSTANKHTHTHTQTNKHTHKSKHKDTDQRKTHATSQPHKHPRTKCILGPPPVQAWLVTERGVWGSGDGSKRGRSREREGEQERDGRSHTRAQDGCT